MGAQIRNPLLICLILYCGAWVSQPCVKIESILAAACTTPSSPEGSNEMMRFRVGDTLLNTSNMQIVWASGQYGYTGVIQNQNTANIVAAFNNSIQSCGFIKQPVNGVLPANSQVIIITGTNTSTTANSFAALSDTIYMIFQNAANPGGHFLNYSTNPPAIGNIQQTTTLSFNNISGCSSTATYMRNQLTMQNGLPGNQPGSTVLFDADMNPTYINNGCIASIEVLSAAWNPPGSICSSDSPIQLNNLISGSQGGFWSGNGVSGTTFNPQGLSGNIPISYAVVNSICNDTLQQTHTINVIPSPNASFNLPDSICAGAGTLTLIDYISGSNTGSFSGQGVNPSGIFNPIGLSGNINITYTVGTGSCQQVLSETIHVASTLPMPSISGNTAFCADQDPGQLIASGNSGAVFNWYSDAALSNLVFTGSNFNPNQTDGLSYWVTQSIQPCVSPPAAITLTVKPIPPAPLIDNEFSFCTGQPLPEMTAIGLQISWYADAGLNNLVHIGNTLQPLTNHHTQFWLTQTVNECTSPPSTTTVNEFSIDVFFSLSDSVGIYPFDINFSNLSENSYNCVWRLNGQALPTLNAGTHTFQSQGIYNLALICESAEGCIGEQIKVITVNQPESTFYIPSSFSPNGDGLNDIFLVVADGIIDFHMQIFNRWGEMLYQSFDKDNGWDGKPVLSDQIAPQGIYVYQITYRDSGLKFHNLYGKLTLLR